MQGVGEAWLEGQREAYRGKDWVIAMIEPSTKLISASEARDIVQAAISEGGDKICRTLEVLTERTLQFMAGHPERFEWANTGQGPTPTYECVFATLGTILCAWAFWILESKGIEHFRVPCEGWRRFMEDALAPTLDAILRDARNLARQGKQEALEQGRIPSNIAIPNPYDDWR